MKSNNDRKRWPPRPLAQTDVVKGWTKIEVTLKCAAHNFLTAFTILLGRFPLEHSSPRHGSARRATEPELSYLANRLHVPGGNGQSSGGGKPHAACHALENIEFPEPVTRRTLSSRGEELRHRRHLCGIARRGCPFTSRGAISRMFIDQVRPGRRSA